MRLAHNISIKKYSTAYLIWWSVRKCSPDMLQISALCDIQFNRPTVEN